ncbi:hypothetical protein [Telmatospirillum sp.]|uniref:hypothetical protein n=1 Tax=Telmatospirillum sp. TaxID=2079197 RepID=UPI002843B0B6|nr:hypothetical protein [Telmatospirillum sp.]MDR3439784.1 hypothetical protein [Telmatospirillum sp.]
METAVPSSSRSKVGGMAVLMAVLLAACASSAPPLPVDTTSVNRVQSIGMDAFSKEDAALSCDRIAAERRDIDAQMQAATGKIEDNRTQNQVAGYLGSQLLLPLLATDNNQAEKQQISQLYARRDVLIKLAAVKDCKGGGAV